MNRQSFVTRGLVGVGAVNGAAALGLIGSEVALASTCKTGGKVIDVTATPYFAVGNGTADDTTRLQDAINAAAGGNTLYAPPDKTFKITSALTITGTLELDFSNSTIKKGVTWSGSSTFAVEVSGSNVLMERLVVDGNKAGGLAGGGVKWTGAGGTMVDSTVRNTKAQGIFITGSGVVTAVRTESSDNASGSNTGDGFYVESSGLLRTYDCIANRNDRMGFFFNSGADTNCYLDGTASRNLLAGASIRNSGGTCEYLKAEDNKYYGLALEEGGGGWTFKYVESNSNGVTDANTTGMGIEMFGSASNTFKTVVAKGNLSYGLALVKRTAGGVDYASHDNTFTSVVCDQTGASSTGPGIHLSGGANHNTFTSVHVTAHSAGVSMGEGLTPATNDYNTFTHIYARNCGYAAVRISGGSHNQFDKVFSADCYTSDSSYPGVVDLSTANTTYNTFTSIDQTATGASPTYVPTYVVHCDANAAHNTVTGGYAREYVTGKSQDQNGTNSITLS